MAKAFAIDCNFGEALLGDITPLVSPFFCGETIAKLTGIKTYSKGSLVHEYDLFLFGVLIGKVEAKQTEGGAEWRVVL